MSAKRVLQSSSSNSSMESAVQPAPKKQRREAATAEKPKAALSSAPARRPPAASVSRALRPTGAATVASAPSRGALRPSAASVAPRGGARPAAPTKAGVGSAAPAGGRRPGWDMRGKVSDMQAKLQSYQSRDRTAQEANQELRGAVAAVQRREEQMGMELESQRSQIRSYQEELQQLPVVREELERTASERAALQRELGGLQETHRVVVALRDSQELELQTCRMKLLLQEASLERLQASLQQREQEAQLLQETVGRQKDELHAGEMERRQLHNTLQELKGNIRVFCRVRPLVGGGTSPHIQLPPTDNKALVLAKSEEVSHTSHNTTHRGRP